jgi:hypothetical protein
LLELNHRIFGQSTKVSCDIGLKVAQFLQALLNSRDLSALIAFLNSGGCLMSDSQDAQGNTEGK